jgi:hypothetical protein
LNELDSIANGTSVDLGIPAAACKILLGEFQWNQERLVERYFSDGSISSRIFSYFKAKNKEKFLNDHHVFQQAPASKPADCQICFDEAQLLGYTCGHLFCADCWKGHLTSKVLLTFRFKIDSDFF